MQQFFGRRVSVRIGALFGIILLTAVSTAKDTRGDLRRQRRELDSQLLEARVRVLRTEPEALRLRRQIEALYRELDRIVENDPTVRKLLRERQALEKRLGATAKTGENRPAKTTSKKKRQPRSE
jgi:hypothetical protein